MESRLDSIVQEVERIITAPYAPSLQDVHDLVQDCSVVILRQWALFKPCQVALLVDVLVDGLARSTYALQLLTAFVSVAAFRDALLRKHPCLFDQFLGKVVDEDDLKYLAICTGLLSAPLPTGLVIPARLAVFITKLVNEMGRDPCEKTILPLHALMTGLKASPGVVTSLPPETMCTMQREFTKILRNLANPMDTLLCLATCARIKALQESRVKQYGDESSPPWLQYMRDFFGPKRAAKSLDLTVLYVIFACSASSTNLSAGKATESINLAIEISDAVGIEQRRAWAVMNQPKVMKLCEKVTRQGISSDLQMMGVTFLAFLLPPTMIPQEVSAIGRSMLLSSEGRKPLEALSDEHVERLAEALIVRDNSRSLGESIVPDFTQFVLTTLGKTLPVDYDDVTRLRVAKAIVFGLQKHVRQSVVKTTASLSVSETTITELISSFPRQPCRTQCDGSPICFAAAARSQNSLIIDILTAQALDHSSGDNGADSRTILMTSLLTKLRSMELIKDCASSKAELTHRSGNLALCAFKDPAPQRWSSRNWREQLACSIMENANVSRAALIQEVEEICRDLETRSLNVEIPLRAAEAERNRFCSENAQLRQEYSLQDQKLQEALATINSLEEEIVRLEEQFETATDQAAQLSANLESAHRELTSQQRDSQETAAFEKEKARTRELDLMAAVTAKEDQLEELYQQLRGQKAETDDVRSNLGKVSEENAALVALNSDLKQEVLQLREHLGAEVQNLQAKLHDEAAESERLRSSLHRAEHQAAADLEVLQRQQQQEVAQVTNESSKYRAESKSLREMLKVAESNAENERESKDKRIQHLERKIQSMRNERAAKAREFSEAQQHIGRLITVMGFKAETDQAHASATQRLSTSSANASQVHDISLQSQLVHEQFQERSPSSRNLTHIANAEARLKTPRVLSDCIIRQDLPSFGRPLSLRQRSERQTLSEADGNSQSDHRSTNRHVPKQSQCPDEQDENNAQNLDLDLDLQFSKDSFFASTSHS